jgi:hypothetical protein
MIHRMERMFGEISKEEKEEAIQYLMNKIPKECLKKISIVVQNKGYFWSADMCFGIYVRNVLREVDLIGGRILWILYGAHL